MARRSNGIMWPTHKMKAQNRRRQTPAKALARAIARKTK